MCCVNSCKYHAPSAFAANTSRKRSPVNEPITPSSSTPAACTTPHKGCSSPTDPNNPSNSPRTPTSHATTSTTAPKPSNSTRNPSTPSPPPPRPTNNKRRTPCSTTKCRATKPPNTPVPPVTNTVPSSAARSFGSSARATARVTRGARISPARIASCDSPLARAGSSPFQESSVSSMSISTNRPGSSASAERTRPHTGEWTKPPSSSPALVATALLVISARRQSLNRSSASHSCTNARTRSTARCIASAGSPAAAPSSPSRPSPLSSAQSKSTVPGREALSSSASASLRPLRSAWDSAAPSAPRMDWASGESCAPSTTVRWAAGEGGGDGLCQPIANRELWWGPRRTAPNCAIETSREPSEATEATGQPASSATSNEVASPSARARETRSADAPRA